MDEVRLIAFRRFDVCCVKCGTRVHELNYMARTVLLFLQRGVLLLQTLVVPSHVRWTFQAIEPHCRCLGFHLHVLMNRSWTRLATRITSQ